MNIQGLASCSLYNTYGKAFDDGLDAVNDPIPFGDCTYTYSDAYKKVDLVSYTISFYDWLDAIVEDAQEQLV